MKLFSDTTQVTKISYTQMFFEKVAKRLLKGQREYKGKSLGKSFSHLIKEVHEEILDIVGWSSITYKKICLIMEKLNLDADEKLELDIFSDDLALLSSMTASMSHLTDKLKRKASLIDSMLERKF